MPKLIQIKRYRLKVGDRYCTLNRHFHAEGVAIPDAADIDGAAVINHSLTARAIILRTHKLQAEVAGSWRARWYRIGRHGPRSDLRAAWWPRNFWRGRNRDPGTEPAMNLP